MNEHYSISISKYDEDDNPIAQQLPEIMQDSSLISNLKVFGFKIFNFNQEPIRFDIEVNINNGLYTSVSEFFYNIASFQKIGPGRAEVIIVYFLFNFKAIKISQIMRKNYSYNDKNIFIK